MRERHDVNNMICKQMQVSSAVCVVVGVTGTAKSTNRGNLTWWERLCYGCIYTADRGLAKRLTRESSSVKRVQIKTTFSSFNVTYNFKKC